MSIRRKLIQNTVDELAKRPDLYRTQRTVTMLDKFSSLRESGFVLETDIGMARAGGRLMPGDRENPSGLALPSLGRTVLGDTVRGTSGVILPPLLQMGEAVSQDMNSELGAFPTLARNRFARVSAGSISLLSLAESIEGLAAGLFSSSVLLNNPLGHQGQPIDPVTGLYRYGHGYRLYNPDLGMFMQYDRDESPFGQGGPNGYAFGFGNPVMHTDPNGRSVFALVALVAIAIAKAIAVAAAIAVGSYLVLQTVTAIASIWLEGDALLMFTSTIDQILNMIFYVAAVVAAGPLAPLAVAACGIGISSAAINIASIYVKDPGKSNILKTAALIGGTSSSILSLGSNWYGAKRPGSFKLQRKKSFKTWDRGGKASGTSTKPGWNQDDVDSAVGIAADLTVLGRDLASGDGGNQMGGFNNAVSGGAGDDHGDADETNRRANEHSTGASMCRAKALKETSRAVQVARLYANEVNAHLVDKMTEEKHLIRC